MLIGDSLARAGAMILLAGMLSEADVPLRAGESFYGSIVMNGSVEANVYRTSGGSAGNGARLAGEAGRRFRFGESGEGKLFYTSSIFYFPSLTTLNLVTQAVGATISKPVAASLDLTAEARADFRDGSRSYRDLNYKQIALNTGLTWNIGRGALGGSFEMRVRDYAAIGPGYLAFEPAIFATGGLGKLQWRLDADFGHKSLESAVVETEAPTQGDHMHHHGGGIGMVVPVQKVPQPSVERASMGLTVSRPLGPQMGLRLGASASRVLSGVSPYFPGLDLLQNGYNLERFDDLYSFEGWSTEARLTRLLPARSQVVLQATYRRLDYPDRPILDANGVPVQPFVQRNDREGLAQIRAVKAFAARGVFERLAITASFTYYRNMSNDHYFRATDRIWLFGFEVGL